MPITPDRASHPDVSDASRHQVTAQGHPATLSLSQDLAAASLGTTAPERLAVLANRQDPEVRAAVASHPATPADTLHALASDAHWVVLGALARNPRVLPEDLTAIAHRAWSPPAFPSSFFEHLTTAVKLGIVQNPHTPAPVLATVLAHETDPVVLAFAQPRLSPSRPSSVA